MPSGRTCGGKSNVAAEQSTALIQPDRTYVSSNHSAHTVKAGRHVRHTGMGTESVDCRCGTEMRLRVEGTERTLTVGNGGDAVEFQGYVCPACGDRRRFEYDEAAGEWRPTVD